MHLIWLSFLPAEEAGGGKILLLQRGAYKEMDACVMFVDSSSDLRVYSIVSFQVSPNTTGL